MTRPTVSLPFYATTATIYLKGRIIGTLSRPYGTRAFQKSVEFGAYWRVSDRDGLIVHVTNIRPSIYIITRALGLDDW